MKPEEAIEELRKLRPRGGIIPQKRAEMIDFAISALKEIQQYRKIGTVEECRKAVEKQKTKKPEVIDQDFDYYKCPVCGEYIWATDNINDHKYCLNCGQAVTL